MSNKCTAYHDDINFLGKPGICWGTKEMESCSCGGDKRKCDFYDYVRQEATPKMTNGDVIRSKSDYDLADFLAAILDNCYHLGTTHPMRNCNKDCPMYNCCNNTKLNNIEEWLNQEVEDELWCCE